MAVEVVEVIRVVWLVARREKKGVEKEGGTR
jgi:hypothetical protein